jgi:PAS domain S-box-containing protein
MTTTMPIAVTVRGWAASLVRRSRTWWRRLSPARQDRLATLGPLLSVLLFLLAIISAFWYLRNEEFEREQESVQRDTEVARQQIRLRLIENQEQLLRIARDISTRAVDGDAFLSQASRFTRERPEVLQVQWVGADHQSRGVYSALQYHPETGIAPNSLPTALAAPSQPRAGRDGPADVAFGQLRELRLPVYSRPFKDAQGYAVFQVQVPLIDRNGFSGAIVVDYSIDNLLRYFVPTEVTVRHAIALTDQGGPVLASSVSAMPGDTPRRASIVHEVPLSPAANGLMVRGEGYRTSIGLISNTLFWMVAALSVLTVWMLLGTWRHVRRRVQMQSALVNETNFRRAMENSMLTGMRAMDLEGRITYVNPAFCAMTGFTEAELIGRLPPFPHWPPDRLEENARIFEQELQGRSPAGGIEVRQMRKDGTLFDARMYVSPLVDARGQQTGWMTSMTNITEAKRIRDQLSASHERFTTVLEGLDAAVSVLSVQQGELLFANRSFRLWFGADPSGHAWLAGGDPRLGPSAGDDRDDSVDTLGGLPAEALTDGGGDTREVYVEPLDKWFDVRSRYLQWTDGRLVQMLIATDVTERRNGELQAAQQAERAQMTSRLMTMGEMASSVAHELNQPLTAITNYCNGMISRVRADQIERDDLVAALEKTSRQAQRAGQVIHRIRAFVKRSEPQRQPAQAKAIVDDAVELAGIELKRRNVAIRVYVAQRLPPVMVDPILIEQVLLNLLKNSAEAVDNAKLPPARRSIELRVVPRHTPEEGGMIEFSVTDNGPGLKEEVIARLYEAFFTTKSEGLGIGLSLCRSIIESHSGRIRAQNLYNGGLVSGCRFTFTLPVEIIRTETRTPPASAVTP